jgi:hypothetical protein
VFLCPNLLSVIAFRIFSATDVPEAEITVKLFYYNKKIEPTIFIKFEKTEICLISKHFKIKYSSLFETKG